MSGKKILHESNFDDGERNGWGEVGHVKICDLVPDERTGQGMCLVTRQADPRALLECPNRTFQDLKGKKIIISFDLRIKDAPDDYVLIMVNAGANNISSVKDPVPNSEWQRYSFHMDLRKPSDGSLDIGAFYRGDQKPTSRLYIDNILIVPDD
ncbi:hypothetical protein ACSPX5_08455 [Pseudomonas sp. HLG18]|uniref:hypothetical protein n=1 Tax=Pseudomonas sp. HLG18 TaxID=3449277 RepID=UPI003F7497F7